MHANVKGAKQNREKKEKYIVKKIERKILGEERQKKALQETEGEWRRKLERWGDRMRC